MERQYELVCVIYRMVIFPVSDFDSEIYNESRGLSTIAELLVQTAVVIR